MTTLRLRPGALADYRALAGFHYLSNSPVTATRVWVMDDCSPSVWQRWRAMRGEPAGADETRVVAVLVESLPALSCAMRDAALPGRYTGMDRRSAARLVNDELRCISRVVVHPQYRGLGLAVRLVRQALATVQTPYTEALAAMGRVHPFFKLAGMTEYQRPPHAKDQRLLDAMRSVGLAPWELASRRRLLARIGESPPPDNTSDTPTKPARIERTRVFYNRRLSIKENGEVSCEATAVALGAGDAVLFRQALRRWAGPSLSFDEQLGLARRKLLTEPCYYLYPGLFTTGVTENTEADY